jgi:hypothetical protein
MKPRLVLILGVVALAGAGLWLATRPSPAPTDSAVAPPPAKPVSKAAPAAPDTAAAPSAAQNPVTAPPATAAVPSIKATAAASSLPIGARPPDVRTDYRADLDNVRLMLRDYRTLMGENPVGSNAEIMKAVMGGNPKRARLGPPEGQNVNASGELVDRWGTPYFFHQISANQMEIRSAGPDGVMWTTDDVVQH